jgi:hypothetical protein
VVRAKRKASAFRANDPPPQRTGWAPRARQAGHSAAARSGSPRGRACRRRASSRIGLDASSTGPGAAVRRPTTIVSVPGGESAVAGAASASW